MDKCSDAMDGMELQDNVVIQEFDRREDMELGLTGYQSLGEEGER